LTVFSHSKFVFIVVNNIDTVGWVTDWQEGQWQLSWSHSWKIGQLNKLKVPGGIIFC